MSQAKKIWIVALAAVVLLCLASLTLTAIGLGYWAFRPRTLASEGGLEVVLRTEADSRDAVLEAIRFRLDERPGLRDVAILVEGDDGIRVQIPGVVDDPALMRLLTLQAKLEFLEVSSAATTPDLTQKAEDFRVERAFAGETPTDADVDAYLLSELLGDLEIRWSHTRDEFTGERHRDQVYAVHPVARVHGGMIGDARVEMDQFNMPYVALEFGAQGKQAFCELSDELTGGFLAIVLDDEVLSAPKVAEPICGGRARIDLGGVVSPHEAQQEAQDLVIALRAGGLPAAVTVESQRVIYPGE